MSGKFYHKKPDELDFVPFDIETTGFKAGEDDIVTTIIMHHNETFNVWLNAKNNVDESELETEVCDNSGLDNINICIELSEKSVFENFSEFIMDLSKENTVFVAFNGETYRGSTDFDMPFLRTRFFEYGLSWPFTGFWYTDLYEIYSQKNRFNTTVTEEPTIDGLKKSEQQKFIDDMRLDIHYNAMKKSEIVEELEKKTVPHMVDKWVNRTNITGNNLDNDNLNSFSKTQLKQLVDYYDLDISYEKLSAKELQNTIMNSDYTPEMLKEWYDKTNRSVGTMNMTTLDGIHEKIVESKLQNEQWMKNSNIKLYSFNPFDPYQDSSEAVNGYEHEEYADLILHCLSDVARTVNLTRIMVEYVSPNDYRPKTL